jgi:glutaredoxin
MQTIEIYYSRACRLCDKAIEFCRSRGVTFTAYAVEWDAMNDEFVDSDITREMYRRCGEKVDFVPQMFIDETHIQGWRKLKPMIKSGEIDRLIPNPKG